MTTPTSAGNLYVFDALVPELQVLVSKVPAGAQVLIIEEGADGFQQLAQFVSSQTELDSIHLISHGSDGQVRLGSSTLSLGTMNQFSADLEAIGKSLSDSGDLLIYGCNVAQGSAGQQLISEIGAISGADVAASTNLTGDAARGGDSILEKHVGDVSAPTLAMNGTNVTLGALDTAANFSYVDALTAAQFSLWAYDEFDATRTTLLQNSGWTSITTGSNTVNGNGYQNSNAFAFAARRSNADGSTEFVISFEGTNGF